MSEALTATPHHGPAPVATRIAPNVARQRPGRWTRAAVLLGAALLAVLALGALAASLLQTLGTADWPLHIWVNGEPVGAAWREQLAGSGLGSGLSLVTGLLLLAALAVGLPLLLGLTVALPLLLVGLVLLGVVVGLVALLGLPLLLLGLVALPLLVPLLLLWWLLRWLVG